MSQKKHNNNNQPQGEAKAAAGNNQGNRFEQFAQTATQGSREQFEALAESGVILTRGFEDLFKTYAELAQQSAEKNSEAVRTLFTSRTLTEFTEAQGRLAQQNLDDFLTGFTRMSELGVRLATEAFEPLNDQMNRSIRKATQSAAA